MIAELLPATRTLEQCEQVIERGLTTFVEVGQALMEIRDARLYREQGYGTFEDYCQARWGWSRITAYRHIQAAQVANLLPIGNAPATESQTRELVPLLRQDEAAVVEVWRDLRQQHGDKITASVVREAVAARLSPREPVDEYEFNKLQVIEANRQGACIEVLPTTNPAHVSYNSGNNEWYTPPEYIEAARRVMGRIDLDPASSDVANGIIKATTYYTADDDGLLHFWRGRIWMNPPYAAELIGKFMDKLGRHYADCDVTEAIVLVNNATETNWFQGLLAYASAVCFIRQRVKFIDVDGNPSGLPLQGQAVLYLGDDPRFFGAEFAPFGTVLYGQRAAWCNQK